MSLRSMASSLSKRVIASRRALRSTNTSARKHRAFARKGSRSRSASVVSPSRARPARSLSRSAEEAVELREDLRDRARGWKTEELTRIVLEPACDTIRGEAEPRDRALLRRLNGATSGLGQMLVEP